MRDHRPCTCPTPGNGPRADCWEDGSVRASRNSQPAGRTDARALDRSILTLAVPAFGALVAEPLFLLTDTALVGHLGDTALAGLGVAATILHTIVGIMVFLAYTTTPVVARLLGSGNRPGAIRAGIEGMWLAAFCGLVLLIVGLPLSAPLVGVFTSDPGAIEAANTYLSLSLWGLPAMLLVIAAMGLLRGLQNTKVPLVVAIAGFAVNGALNAVFIYGFGWGIAGSALGTVIAQWGMAIVYIVIAVRAGRELGVSLRPGIGDPRTVFSANAFMVLRTLTLRASLVVLVWAAGQQGVAELASLQILLSVNSLIAFTLDALAIAGQAMVGHALGAGDTKRVTAISRRLKQWGFWFGVILAVVFAALAWVLGYVFTSDTAVLSLLPVGFLILAAGTPIAGFVYVLDGILIGAGDVRYLALAGIPPLLVLVVGVTLVLQLGMHGAAGLGVLWASFAVGTMGARALVLGARERGTKWLVPGAAR
ncbi:MATE family efflux transporter [Pseudoclavibacter sp. VKM Ac-2867]|nr:MATE family efflux transporter [Pseudoclavibacter sp. VKM Ac-2867]